MFGLLVAGAALRFLSRGWVDSLLLDPKVHLTYPGFDWVAPLPAPFAHLHLLVVTASGVAIALGWRTKAALGVFLFGFVWLELIDASLYLNHYWLVTLLGVGLLALPVGRRWALDVRAGRQQLQTETVAWVVWALRGQLAVVYLFAGIGKLNGDWLAHGQPLGVWLAARTDRPLIGPWLAEPWVATVASLASAAFDLTIVGWLLWRRSRPYAYVVVVVFHLATAMLFQIGLFPWMMIALTPVFFAPNWPERSLGAPDRAERAALPRPGRGVTIAVSALVAINLIVPLRHYLEPGDVRTNEAGYYGSFRVMLTEKTGFVRFLLHDPDTGARWEVAPEELFADWQVSQLSTRRDLLITATHLIAQDARDRGHDRVEVRADAWISFDGRPREPFVDPTLDLARVARLIR